MNGMTQLISEVSLQWSEFSEPALIDQVAHKAKQTTTTYAPHFKILSGA